MKILNKEEMIKSNKIETITDVERENPLMSDGLLRSAVIKLSPYTKKILIHDLIVIMLFGCNFLPPNLLQAQPTNAYKIDSEKKIVEVDLLNNFEKSINNLRSYVPAHITAERLITEEGNSDEKNVSFFSFWNGSISPTIIMKLNETTFIDDLNDQNFPLGSEKRKELCLDLKQAWNKWSIIVSYLIDKQFLYLKVDCDQNATINSILHLYIEKNCKVSEVKKSLAVDIIAQIQKQKMGDQANQICKKMVELECSIEDLKSN